MMRVVPRNWLATADVEDGHQPVTWMRRHRLLSEVVAALMLVLSAR
jgi:hypothetical protein